MNQLPTIRLATSRDMEAVHALVRELAEFEQEPDAVSTSAAIFRRDAFESEREWFFCYVAELPEEGIIGIALCYYAYSTWKGKMTYLDDLVVKQAFRRQRIGLQLIRAVVRHAREAGTNMVKWQVLDWNEPAIQLYKKIGATFDGEWIDCKLYC